MKKLLFFALFLAAIIGCSSSKKELYEKTDSFIQSLSTTYESYGFFESGETTSDGLYTIKPIGRLINVKIEAVVEKEEYEDLRKDLEDHYKNNYKVREVYICQAGTVMIDCRN